MARGQIVEQRIKLQVAERCTQFGALLQVIEHIRFRRKGAESLEQDVDREVGELGLPCHRAERLIEKIEVLGHLLVGDLHVGDTHRYLRRDPGGDEPLPQDALLLDVLQVLVDVTDVHAGAHVLASEFLEPTAIRRRHLWRVLAGGCRGDELAQRPVEDHRKEPVEGVADINEQAQVDAEFIDRLERTHARAGDEIGCALKQPGKLGVVKLLRDAMGTRSGFAGREIGAVPRRIPRPIAELSEAGGFHHRAGRGAAVIRHELDRFAGQPRGGGRRVGKQSEA